MSAGTPVGTVARIGGVAFAADYSARLRGTNDADF
jgi:hypothetical protein